MYFGICYAIGVGVEENPSFARDYLNKAISVGNDEVKTVAKDVLKNLNESQKKMNPKAVLLLQLYVIVLINQMIAMN